MNPCFAIIESNTLVRISLGEILSDMYDQVEILPYGTISEFIKDSNRHFIHFFIGSEILFNNIDEFELLKQQTTVLSIGATKHFEEAGYNVLDMSRNEHEIRSTLLNLQFIGSFGALHEIKHTKGSKNRLSDREREVLKLMIKGLINKEIAQELGISLPTVIFHRNNICEKLQTRSIGKMTIFAVLSGIIGITDI